MCSFSILLLDQKLVQCKVRIYLTCILVTATWECQLGPRMHTFLMSTLSPNGFCLERGVSPNEDHKRLSVNNGSLNSAKFFYTPTMTGDINARPRQSRIPSALQAVFLASNRGKDVDAPPPENVAYKVFFRNWRLQRQGRSKENLKTTAGFFSMEKRSPKANIRKTPLSSPTSPLPKPKSMVKVDEPSSPSSPQVSPCHADDIEVEVFVSPLTFSCLFSLPSPCLLRDTWTP